LQQRSIWKRYKLWLFCLILAMMAIAGGITGGLLRGKRKAALDESSPIIALASTECEAGTFVFYQTNSSEIFMEGRFRDATFNGTVSPNITSTRIKIPSDDVLPIMGTNMTAVCGYSGISSAVWKYFPHFGPALTFTISDITPVLLFSRVIVLFSHRSSHRNSVSDDCYSAIHHQECFDTAIQSLNNLCSLCSIVWYPPVLPRSNHHWSDIHF
jgi:hypothetical protein